MLGTQVAPCRAALGQVGGGLAEDGKVEVDDDVGVFISGMKALGGQGAVVGVVPAGQSFDGDRALVAMSMMGW